MSTLKSIIFETLPDPDEYWETAEALKDLDRQYQHFTRTVWKASKQLLKFDEINRLVAYEVEEKAPKTTTARASSGRSSSSSKSTSTGSKSTSTKSNPKTNAADPQVPDLSKDFALELNLKDILFNWLDLDWEKVMATLIAGLTTISGLADTIARAITELGNRPQRDQEIRVFLDERRLSDAVTRYQRRSNDPMGINRYCRAYLVTWGLSELTQPGLNQLKAQWNGFVLKRRSIAMRE